MRAVSLLIATVATLVFKVSGQTNCQKQSALFGTTTLATQIDDVALLRSSTFQPTMVVSAINVCGTFGGFDGIQLFLNNTLGQTLTLNQIGRTSSCTKWVIQASQYVASVYLTYNSGGTTSLKVTTNKGTTFSVGTMISGDISMTQAFTPTTPLIGIWGYQTTVLKALGFYTYNCVPTPTNTTTNSTTNTTSNTTNTTTTTNSTTVVVTNSTTTDFQETLTNFTQPVTVTKTQKSTAPSTGLLVGVILIIVLLICLSLGFVFFLVKRTKAMTKLTKVDAEVIGDQEMFPEKQSGFTMLDSEIDHKAEVKQTPRLGHEIACGPLEEMDEEQRKQIEYERDLLKGKSLIDKKRLLTDLQKQKEKEMQMHFRMERQQLRHDEQMAKRKIEERDRIEDVFRVVYGEVPKEDVSKETSAFRQFNTPGDSLTLTTPILDGDSATEMVPQSKPQDPQEAQKDEGGESKVTQRRPSRKRQTNNYLQSEHIGDQKHDQVTELNESEDDGLRPSLAKQNTDTEE